MRLTVPSGMRSTQGWKAHTTRSTLTAYLDQKEIRMCAYRSKISESRQGKVIGRFFTVLHVLVDILSWFMIVYVLQLHL